MLSKNLKFYRLKNTLTKKELAERIQVTPMAISNYESGKRKPDMELLKRLANVLGVRVSDFLEIRNEQLCFRHGEFRKHASLTLSQQEFIQESVEEYFNRFMTAVEILGGEILPSTPACQSLDLSGDAELDARNLRAHLNLAPEGPISNLVEILENKGFLIYVSQIENGHFSGLNGSVNDRPYIVINQTMSPERNRSTIVHELAHLMFRWPDNLVESKIEELATAISGAFLLPETDAKRELGIHRSVVSRDMELVAQEYGISMYLLVKRAQVLGIISESSAQKFYVQTSKMGWRKNEPSRIEREKPLLFEQLVYRAVSENEINMQRGAELLKIPYDVVVSNCLYNGD